MNREQGGSHLYLYVLSHHNANISSKVYILFYVAFFKTIMSDVYVTD